MGKNTSESGQMVMSAVLGLNECKKCGAKIRWVETAGCKSVPIDAKVEKRYVYNDEGRFSLINTFAPHFATCPFADEFRRKK